MHRNLPAVVLACLLSGVIAAQEQTRDAGAPPASAPAAPPAELGELLTQLDSPDYAQREAAERKLLELAIGEPEWKAWIEKASHSEARPEVRTRLASVLAKLAEHRLLGATPITMHMNDVHPRQIVSELSRQSGIRFEFYPQDPWDAGGLSAGKLSIDLEREPFWDALRKVCEATGLSPMEHQPTVSGGMVLSQHGEQFGIWPTRHHGAFAVQLRRLRSDSSSMIELGVDPQGNIAGNTNSNSSLSVEMRILVEPKIRLTGPAIEPILEAAVDEHGNDLTIAAQEHRFGGRDGWASATTPWSVQAQFPLDARAAAASHKLARIKGRLQTEVATEVVRLEIKVADLADVRRITPEERLPLSKRYNIGGYQIELTGLRRMADDSLHLEFIVSHSGTRNQEQWARMQVLGNALRLEDAAGRQWGAMGGNTNWDDTTAQMSRGFQRSGGENLGPALQFVWEVPARTMVVSIPFEFTDVPLPVAD